MLELPGPLPVLAAASLGVSWGWLLWLVLRSQRGRVGQLACGLATVLVGLETFAFLGGRGAFVFAVAATGGSLAHRAWWAQLRSSRRSQVE